MPLSRSSSSFLIDWRPSRLLAISRAILCLLALLAIALSAVPAPLGAALGLLAVAGTVLALRRDLARASQVLRIADDGTWAVLLQAGARPRLYCRARVRLRGPMARLEAKDRNGRVLAWNWWPDTLDRGSRRRLRLASGRPIGTSGPALATMPG
jgi:hypothetical protein